MNELTKTSGVVKAILEQNPETRNSDNLLYMEVLKVHGFETQTEILKQSVGYFLRNMNLYACPKFETVRRARQKIQANFPELRACESVAEARTDQIAEFRNFALG